MHLQKVEDSPSIFLLASPARHMGEAFMQYFCIWEIRSYLLDCKREKWQLLPSLFESSNVTLILQDLRLCRLSSIFRLTPCSLNKGSWYSGVGLRKGRHTVISKGTYQLIHNCSLGNAKDSRGESSLFALWLWIICKGHASSEMLVSAFERTILANPYYCRLLSHYNRSVVCELKLYWLQNYS